MIQCPGAAQLERLLHDQLSSTDSEAIALHIERCETCRELLDRIINNGRSNGRAAATSREVSGARELVERLKTMGPLLESNGRPTAGPTARHAPESNVDASLDQSTEEAINDSRFRQPLPVFDGFRIIREIGRGGMGVVYEAEEERLSRRVALKVLPASLLTHAKQVQRFEREARAAARLHHTNIVPVFGVGENDGHHYYFMQYIEGKTLAASLDEQRECAENGSVSTRLDRQSRSNGAEIDRYRRVATIGLQVAEALDHAHAQGILHRDIKPSNLIEDDKGNVWVADFGLAKTLDDNDLTTAGELLGTVRYMAPERLAGAATNDPISMDWASRSTSWPRAGRPTRPTTVTS